MLPHDFPANAIGGFGGAFVAQMAGEDESSGCNCVAEGRMSTYLHFHRPDGVQQIVGI